jgi:hypothetical protein
VEVMADELGNLLPGAHIIADTHYELGNKLMKRFEHEKQVVFYTSIAKLHRRKKKVIQELPNDLSFQLTGLSKEQETWNNRHRHIRSRVESPFGLLKLKWKGLEKPFFENEEQQTFLLFIAVATHNYQIDNS